jgi:predicted phosphodiesterase
VPDDLIRIFSDLHCGDRASGLRSPSALAPLLDGAAKIVLNGDTLDTRASRNPADTAALRAEVCEFFARRAPPATLLTGNHDPDISSDHLLELAGGRVLVTHGDILFDDLVPWARDAPVLRRLIATELDGLPPPAREQLEPRLAAFRRVAGSVPQRHQSERNRLKYALAFASDTVWPPSRVLSVLRAWREAPGCAAAFSRRYRPRAEFFIMGHIHRPGAWQPPGGPVVLNTGSFCPPLGGAVVDLTSRRIALRRIERRHGEYRLGATLAEFALAGA